VVLLQRQQRGKWLQKQQQVVLQKWQPKGKVMNIGKIFIFTACFLLFNIFLLATEAKALACRDGNNNDINVEGFSTAIVYCVKNSIKNAITRANGTEGYLPEFAKFATPFMWAGVMLAISLFGVKLVTMGVDQVLKESMELVFRIAIVASLVLGASYYYTQALNIMGVLIGFVATGFVNVAPPDCTFGTLPPDANATEFLAWQKIDCMIQGMIGLSTDPKTIVMGMGFIIAVSLLSGTFGIAVAIAGLTALILVIMTIARAIYIFILSYFVVGLLLVMTPLFAPMLLFDNGYTRKFFWNWVSGILSYILQPMFLIAFLSFAVMVQDKFINGSFKEGSPGATAPYCKPETFSTGGDSVNGSGVCSFRDLLAPGEDPKNYTSSTKELNTTSVIDDPTRDQNWGERLVSWGTDQLNKLKNALGSWAIKGFTSITTFPLKSFFVTLIAFIIITWVMKDLLNTVPRLAQRITGGLSNGLFQQADVPFEQAAQNAMGAGKASARQYASGARGDKKGLDKIKPEGIQGLKNAGGGALSGVKQAAQSLANSAR
jgi:hypothetical protein